MLCGCVASQSNLNRYACTFLRNIPTLTSKSISLTDQTVKLVTWLKVQLENNVWSKEDLVWKNHLATICGILWPDTLPVYTVGCLQVFLEVVWRLSVKPLCFHKANRFGNMLPFPHVLRPCRHRVSSWRGVRYMGSKSMSLVFLVHIYFMSDLSCLSNKNYFVLILGVIKRLNAFILLKILL